MSLAENLPLLLALVCGSAFLKTLLALALISQGMDLRGFAVGIANLVVALVVGAATLQSIPPSLDAPALAKHLDIFLTKHTSPVFADRMVNVTPVSGEPDSFAGAPDATAAPEESTLLRGRLVAFVLSQATDACMVALLVLIPFLVVDLILGGTLAALGVTQLPVASVALPLKLMLFLAADGWLLFGQRMMRDF